MHCSNAKIRHSFSILMGTMKEEMGIEWFGSLSTYCLGMKYLLGGQTHMNRNPRIPSKTKC